MKKGNSIKRFLNYIGKLLSSAILILLLIIGAFLIYYLISAKMVSNNPGYEPKISLYTIVSGSMTPNINVYDVIVDSRVDNPDNIKVGDVITFRSTSSISRDLIVTHRVVDIKQVNGKIEYVTKGDYNATSDSDTAKFENVIGKVVMRFPQLGRVQFFLATKMGWFIVVLLPAACVIIYDIIKLIKLIAIKKNSDSIKDTVNDNPDDNIKVNYYRVIDKQLDEEYQQSTTKDNKKTKNNKNLETDEIINETLRKIKKNDYVDSLNDLKKYKK